MAAATARESDFAIIFEKAGSAIGKVAPDGRFLVVNQAYCDLTGYSRDELLAGGFQQITHPDDLESDLAALQALLAGEADRYSKDKRYVRKRGRDLWVRLTVSLVRRADGSPDFFIKVAENIDSEKKAEQALAAREAQLRTIVETVPVGLVMAELPSGRIVGGNGQVEQMLRHPILYSPDIHSYGEWPAFHADGRPVESHEYPLARMALNGEHTPSIDVNYRRGDGTYAWTRISGRAVRNGAGELTGGVVALVDIDEERKAMDRAAEQLESVRGQLIHTSRVSAMGTMASTIAHEVNQPLTAIAGCFRGSIKLVERGAPAEEVLRWLERGEQIALRAGETIRRLRAMLTRGEVKRERVELARLIGEANAIGLVGAATDRIEYSQDVDPALAAIADPIQIQQVLINLMRNAIEAMADSPVRRLSIAARQSGECVEIIVRDSGPGLPEALSGNPFEPFQSTKPLGMGVGLSICRTIVESHGGRIWVAEAGSGTAMTFTLPAA
ncbi:PAS domain S-box protein [Allosphingosinicella sp.]|uniref:sensor histidine kinase n=1 Tax=Allosphingosinicella sp. TaxID=2823234 RepID=UPI002EF13EAB